MSVFSVHFVPSYTKPASPEAFLIYSQSIPSQNLGFVDSKAPVLVVDVAGRELTVHQSPSLLTSNRKEGTTGAVVWKVTPLFAEWLANSKNALFQRGLLNAHSTILELGCGVSGIVARVVGPKVAKYIATDQEYALKVLRRNVDQDSPVRGASNGKATKHLTKTAAVEVAPGCIEVLPLDWELDEVERHPALVGGMDAVLACDCIYNESLILPLVNTCADICRLRADTSQQRTLCIVAQQLRSFEVFEAWLKAFHRLFRVWQVSDKLLIDPLKEGSGFVIHIGILRQE